MKIHKKIHMKIHIKRSILRLLCNEQVSILFLFHKKKPLHLPEGSELTRGSFKESQLTKAKTWPEASQVFFSEADTIGPDGYYLVTPHV